MIVVDFAGIPVLMDNRFAYLERLCREYLSDEPPAFTVSATPMEIEEERRVSEEAGLPDGYLESVVLYRKVAERLHEYDAFVFHGAILAYCGEAYAFTARSGVGKTTHTRLWLKEFGKEAYYLNGDKPIIRFIDGAPYAFGTPYKGKEGYGVPGRLRLSGIAFLERAERNSARRLDPSESSMKLLTQIYLPHGSLSAVKTMKLADRLLNSVRLVGLYCNMDGEAAHVAKAALTEP